MESPTSWKKARLADVVTLHRGYDLPHSERRSGPYPVLSAGKVVGSHDKFKVAGPGFTIGRATNLGQPTWCNSNFWPLNTTLYAQDFHGNEPRFLYHLFRSLDFSGFNSGSVQPMLNRNYIASIPVFIPPLSEQQAIADVLGALDDKIAANARIETTLSDAGRLFFELARSEASSLVPVPTAIKITFGEPFIGELFNSIQIGRPLLRIRDIGQRRCDVWTTEVRDRETLIRPGDAVAGMDADFSPAIWLGEPSLLNQRVCHISSHDLGTAFALEIARSGFTQIQNEKSGTTVIHLNKSDLERTSVYLPNGPSAQRLASSADEARRTLVAIAEESRTLEELRDTLLPALMDGRIRVKDAVRTAEEAL